MIGAPRAAADHQAAMKLVNACGSLPLAVRIVGARLVLWPYRFAGSEVVAVGLPPSGAAKYYFYWWRDDGIDLAVWQVRE